MRNWPGNSYTKETDQKYMDAALVDQETDQNHMDGTSVWQNADQRSAKAVKWNRGQGAHFLYCVSTFPVWVLSEKHPSVEFLKKSLVETS